MYFDWCSHSVTLLFAGEPTSTAQTYRSVTLATAYPKPKEVHDKINLKRSNATKSTSRNLCPSPMATSCCHRSSQDHARSGFLAPAFVIYIYIFIYIEFLTFKKQVGPFCWSIFLPKSESRLSGLSAFAVTYRYASMSRQLGLEMCGIVSRVSLGCCCGLLGT